MEGAAAFLEQLDEKARDKIIYNIRKAQVTNDKELLIRSCLRSLLMKSGNLESYIATPITGSLLFRINQIPL
jgi:hypothetical protein